MRNKVTKRKPPSRVRYEESHRVFSARLDRETGVELQEHLHNTGSSFGDFVKGTLGEEKEMVAKRIEMLASRQLNSLAEDRIRCLEDLVHQVLLMTYSLFMTVDADEWPPYCPHCDNQKLIRCEGRATESSLVQPWVTTWKCPKCGFFVDTYKRIDPKSIEWLDFHGGSPAGKPKASARSRQKKSR